MLRGVSGEGGDTLPKDAQGQGKRQQTSCLGKFCLYIYGKNSSLCEELLLKLSRVVVETMET